MAKEDSLTFEGKVTEVLPGSKYRVKIDGNGHVILAYLSGRMKKNKIHVIEGDRVNIEMTPYDLDRGRISYRHK